MHLEIVSHLHHTPQTSEKCHTHEQSCDTYADLCYDSVLAELMRKKPASAENFQS